MDIADKVAASPARAKIEEKILAGIEPILISQQIAIETNLAVEPEEIIAYKKKYLKEGKGLCHDIMSATRDLAKFELPAATEIDTLSSYFSFQRTNDDLELIYERVRELTELARKNPSDDNYDKRVCDYLKRAESIRERIFKGQFEDLRRSILLNIGKKIVVAAISVLMPYVGYGKRDEAKRLFMDAIEPLLNPNMAPPVPADIEKIVEEANGKSTEA